MTHGAIPPLAANSAGFAGMACIIFAYAYATSTKAPNPFIQHGVNLAGAGLLTISLLVNMNPASFVLEFFWAAIAIWGLVKAARTKGATAMIPPLIIAVDGPTASGKGTIARALAEHYGLPHLDTGLLYRAVGRQVSLAGGNPDSPEDALAACAFPDALLADPELRSEASGGLASRVSVHPGVRAALYERQRAFATQASGAVLDGRDIGTVIAPEAAAKLFVTASVEARARRRFNEMLKAGRPVTLAEIEGDLAARDERDRTRAEAPLRAAEDAVVLDNSAMSRDESIAAALRIVDAAKG